MTARQRLRKLVNGARVFLFLYLCSPSVILASVDICQDPAAYSHLAVGFDSFGESTLDNDFGLLDRENFNFDLLLQSPGEKFLYGAGHRYSIFDFEPERPETNGHLHTFFLPLHRLTGDDRQNFRLSIAPALSGSSNVGPELDDYADDAFQILAALIWGKQLSTQVSLRYGICGDHRFGHYKIYPVLGAHWQPHPDWQIQLGFPTSQIAYQLSAQSTASIRISPDGNEWYVRDRSFSSPSRFISESYVLLWAFDWQLHDSFALTLSIGRQFHNRMEIIHFDQSRVRLSGDPVTRVGAELEWRF